MINLRRVLDKRSYRVYLLHDEEHKFFPEIGELIGVTRSRAWQIYRAGIQRIELKKRGGDVWPEYSLSLWAIHCIHRAFGKTNVHKRGSNTGSEKGQTASRWRTQLRFEDTP